MKSCWPKRIHELFMPASWASRSVVRLLCHGDWPGKHQQPCTVRAIACHRQCRSAGWNCPQVPRKNVEWKKPLPEVYRHSLLTLFQSFLKQDSRILAQSSCESGTSTRHLEHQAPLKHAESVPILTFIAPQISSGWIAASCTKCKNKSFNILRTCLQKCAQRELPVGILKI